MNRILFAGLMLLVVLSPLPLGSNRAWSWSLCALVIAALAAAWAVANAGPRGQVTRFPQSVLLCLFALACGWVLVQIAPWVPAAWKHPLWAMVADVLDANLPGTISFATDDGLTALMRLLSYALVFVLAYQLCRERNRAQAAFAWMTLAGLAYAVFGLYVYWSGYQPEWFFGSKVLAHDVRSTFINRNHFVTWQGLALLCAIAWFYQHMARPVVKPYFVPQDRDARVEEFILKAWKPLLAVLLMVTALVLTHSRGGFTSTLVGSVVLLVLLDRRGSARKGLSRATVIAALAVASIAFYLTSEVLLERIGRTDITTEERLEVFANVNRGIADNPLLGFGYGTFADSFRLYDRNEEPWHYDRAHNTWLENTFELGLPVALALFLSIAGLAWVCLRGVKRRHRDWVYPATGVAASVLVGLHATVDFSLQIPAVAILYAAIMGVACAQSYSTVGE
ncbi:MAG TPA: O-antigen ligase family protein [Xanthomonadales bacterium]|nr:O-antigen ligase family protein [Xanthomonadales bacterium]